MRNLCVGTTTSVESDTSSAGLSVRVTMGDDEGGEESCGEEYEDMTESVSAWSGSLRPLLVERRQPGVDVIEFGRDSVEIGHRREGIDRVNGPRRGFWLSCG